jgi:hypothetical protein
MPDATSAAGPAAIPAFVNRFLLPQEALRLQMRQFPIMLAMPLAAALGGLLAAIAVSEIPGIAAPARFAVWIIVAFLLARLAAAAISWPAYRIVITDRRLLVISGISTVEVTVSPIEDFAAISYKRPLAGRLIGYGTVIINLTSGAALTFDYMTYSEQIYLELSNFIADRGQGK